VLVQRLTYAADKMLIDLSPSWHGVILLFPLVAVLALLLVFVGPWVFSKVSAPFFGGPRMDPRGPGGTSYYRGPQFRRGPSRKIRNHPPNSNSGNYPPRAGGGSFWSNYYGYGRDADNEYTTSDYSGQYYNRNKDNDKYKPIFGSMSPQYQQYQHVTYDDDDDDDDAEEYDHEEEEEDDDDE